MTEAQLQVIEETVAFDQSYDPWVKDMVAELAAEVRRLREVLANVPQLAMNVPCRKNDEIERMLRQDLPCAAPPIMAYKLGHRDARHSIAEIGASLVSSESQRVSGGV